MSIERFFWILLDNAVKYFFVALPFFLLYYVVFKKKYAPFKIQLKFPSISDYSREIIFSSISVMLFSIPPLILLFNPMLKAKTTFYENISDHSTVYFILAFPLMLFIHDAYFYWIHRGMHHPLLFKYVHLIHHRSNNPSPWAAYAFHPLEAIIESMIFVLFLFTIPVHAFHLMWFFVVSLIYNVYGHLGYEIYPKKFNKHWLGRWLNTSVAHNQHHQYSKGNYGLYFIWWDRWMGTVRKDYDEAYTALKNRNTKI